ncbi:MAG TPA: hypothetical protein VK689_16855 [Armatimonadota bacterium]|nr:hypothetical protein [Armatimonadota bacterium]
MTDFIGVELLRRPDGGWKSHVCGGLDVWEYVMLARDYNWDVSLVAEHLDEPEERVRLALDYYRANPAEVDERLRETLEAGQRFMHGLPAAVLSRQ